MTPEDPRIPKMEAEIERLRAELATLERQWQRKHLLGLFGLAAIPCYFAFGAFVASVVLVCTPALVATQAYLLYVRRMECVQLIAETRNEIALARRGPAPRISRAPA
jgi:hypothetical protein